MSSKVALDLDPKLAAHLVPARQLEERRGHRATGLAGLDALLGGGWPRAALCELRGQRSSGRTAILFSSLARAIAAGETAALIDTGGTLDPRRAAACGIALPRLLWIRCAPEQALKATDMVIAAGGFDLVALDLGDGRPRVPTACWIRLKHGAERQGATVVVATPTQAVGAFAAAAVALATGAPRFAVETPVTAEVAPAPLFHGLRARTSRQRGKHETHHALEEEEARCAWLAFSCRS